MNWDPRYLLRCLVVALLAARAPRERVDRALAFAVLFAIVAASVLAGCASIPIRHASLAYDQTGDGSGELAVGLTVRGQRNDVHVAPEVEWAGAEVVRIGLCGDVAPVGQPVSPICLEVRRGDDLVLCLTRPVAVCARWNPATGRLDTP